MQYYKISFSLFENSLKSKKREKNVRALKLLWVRAIWPYSKLSEREKDSKKQDGEPELILNCIKVIILSLILLRQVY